MDPKVSKRNRRGVIIAGLLLAGPTTLVSSPSLVSGSGSGGVLQSAGTLRIHISSAGSTITYTGPLAVPSSQVISIDSRCNAASATTLLAITQTGGTGAGIVNNGMGVKTKNTCATAQGQFTGSQTLTIALGSAFPADVRVDTAEFDVEAKHGARFGVQLDASATVTVIPLSTSADNGPDSGVGDNNRVIVTENFRSATLSAVGGAIAFEGGGDGTYAQYLAAGLVGPIGTSLTSADTILKLVREYDHAVACGGFVNATVLGGAASSATFTRNLNSGAAECEDIPVTLQILATRVSLLKTTLGLQTEAPQAVNAQLRIVWAPVAAPVPVPLSARQIDLDGDGSAFGFESVRWCSGFDTVTLRAIHPDDARFPGGKLPWCLVSSTEVLQANGTVVQTQVYDGSGDPFWR